MTFVMSPEPWDEIVMCQKEKKNHTKLLECTRNSPGMKQSEVEDILEDSIGQ